MKTICSLFIISSFIIGAVTDDIQSVSVNEGDSLTLHTDIIIQRHDVIEWRFGREQNLIAKLNREANTNVLDNGTDGRFSDRLKLNDQTGDLTITNIKAEHTGVYLLDITGEKIITMTFNVTGVFGDEVKTVSVIEGDSVTLHTDVSNISKYNVIRWRFQHGDSFLAELDRGTGIFPKYDVHDKIFGDRLQVDVQTGSLTIQNIRMKHSGVYEVDVITRTHTIHKSFTVTVSDEVKTVSVTEGHSVTLNTNTDIQTHDVMDWRFGHLESLIATIKKDANVMSLYDDVLDGRFKNRLNLNNQNGSLTIIKSRTTDSGLYELKISNKRQSVHRRFIVTVSELGLSSGVIAGICVSGFLVIAALAVAGVFYFRLWCPKARTQEVMEGDAVILHADVAVRPDDDVMKWRFQNTLIAEIRSTNVTNVYDDVLDGRFRGRLTLRQTGSLNITDTRPADAGVYQLKICSSRETSYKRFRLIVLDPNRGNDSVNMSLMNGNAQHRSTEDV